MSKSTDTYERDERIRDFIIEEGFTPRPPTKYESVVWVANGWRITEVFERKGQRILLTDDQGINVGYMDPAG